MAIGLVVTQPFASYAKGERIEDADTVKKLLAQHETRVVKINIPDPPPAPAVPAAEATPAPPPPSKS